MFRDINGLRVTNPEGRHEENSFLYTVEEFVIRKKKGMDTSVIQAILDRALELMVLDKGLYRQNPTESIDPNNKNSYMSHDQLTAILIYMKMTGKEDRIKEIMSRFKFGISYNNITDSLRVFHPRDLIFYHILHGSKVAYLFLPLLYIITIVMFIQEYKYRNNSRVAKTDGEILYYIKRECSCIFKPIDWFAEMRVKQRFGTWDSLFHFYFKEPKHPINLIRNK